MFQNGLDRRRSVLLSPIIMKKTNSSLHMFSSSGYLSSSLSSIDIHLPPPTPAQASYNTYLPAFHPLIFILVHSFPPVRGTYPGKGAKAGYVPPMKEASVIWRRGDEGGKGMRDFKLRSHFWLWRGRKLPILKCVWFACNIAATMMSQNYYYRHISAQS